jgi:hypothetical protein
MTGRPERSGQLSGTVGNSGAGRLKAETEEFLCQT